MQFYTYVFLSNFGVKSWCMKFQNFDSLASKKTKKGTGHDKTGCKTGSGPRKKSGKDFGWTRSINHVCQILANSDIIYPLGDAIQNEKNDFFGHFSVNFWNKWLYYWKVLMIKAEVKHKIRKAMFREQYLTSHVRISVFNT